MLPYQFFPGVHAIAIPGEVKGYFAAKKKFGNSSISMAQLMKPTILMCQNGIKVSRSLHQAIKNPDTIPVIEKDPTLRLVFRNKYCYFHVLF